LKINILIDWLNLIFQNLFYWLKAFHFQHHNLKIEQMDYIEDIAVKRMQKVIGATVKKDGELLESLDFDAGGISKSVDWQGGGEFIYFELDKYNQKYIDKLNAIKRGHGTAKTIEQKL
jgi:adenine-specific DNA-methyltransferase